MPIIPAQQPDADDDSDHDLFDDDDPQDDKEPRWPLMTR